MNELITEQQIADVRKEVAPVLEAAKALQVVDEDSYLQAMELGRQCDSRAKRVEAIWSEAKSKSYAAYKSILDTIGSFTKPLQEAKKVIGQKAYTWKREEDEKRRREEARLREEAQQRAEEERLREASQLAAEGKEEQADQVLEKPIIVEAPKIERVSKVENAAMRENWQFEIVDENAIPREYLIPDRVKIGKVVKALKGETKISGVKVFDIGSVAFKN